MLDAEHFALLGLESISAMVDGSDLFEFLSARQGILGFSLECLLWRLRGLSAAVASEEVLIFGTEFMENPCDLTVDEFQNVIALVREFSSASTFVFLVEGEADFAGSDYVYEIKSKDDVWPGAIEYIRVR